MKYGRYETLKELGRGSMGVVYEAYDPQIDRTLALKVLRPDYCANEPSVMRFLREAQTIGRLSHPRIVTVYDAGEDRGTLFIAMELLEGRPLSELLPDRRFTAEEILDLGIQMAQTRERSNILVPPFTWQIVPRQRSVLSGAVLWEIAPKRYWSCSDLLHTKGTAHSKSAVPRLGTRIHAWRRYSYEAP